MKKIGILTYHNADNYGGVLQAYALQTFIKQLDKEVNIIDYRNLYIDNQYKVFNFRWNKDKSVSHNIILLIVQLYYIPARLKRFNVFTNFRDKYLTSININEINSLDAVVYGSDQIWNTFLTGGFDSVFFGEGFIGQKISYAASDDGKLDIDTNIIHYLKKFKAISCREESFTKRISDILSIHNVETVCDPVFLIDKEKWNEVAGEKVHNNYILVYKIADNPQIDNDAKLLGKKLNKKIIYLVYEKSIKKFFDFSNGYKKAVSPFDFVKYFRDADMILTTSFHGTAFSLIFRKSFYSYIVNTPSERINNLLCVMGLQERLLKSIDFSIDDKLHQIKYTSESELRMKEYIQRSMRFIKDQLIV